jgi:tRNA U34 5-methylaminomethyl-2-thiouridine-forming methyltransferase MnmC
VKKRRIVTTADGSKSIFLPEWNEHYHSHHGAWQESAHVYIDCGLAMIDKENIDILEMGFGTGLNTLLTLKFGMENGKEIRYHAIEAYPLIKEEWESLGYPELLKMDPKLFGRIHEMGWEEEKEIIAGFRLCKYETKLEYFQNDRQYDLIYYDAFGPRVQEDLWNSWAFELMYEQMRPGAVLVTYSSKGSVRRILIDLGLKVEKLPGPPGKREMLRATK